MELLKEYKHSHDEGESSDREASSSELGTIGYIAERVNNAQHHQYTYIARF